jgi:hypothetical protein
MLSLKYKSISSDENQQENSLAKSSIASSFIPAFADSNAALDAFTITYNGPIYSGLVLMSNLICREKVHYRD